jgi:hypothetical protein
MSAYIESPEHFGILAAYAVGRRSVVREWDESGNVQTAQHVARELARENIRSVVSRYPTSTDGNRPGPRLLDAEIEEAAAIYAAHFIQHPQGLASVEVLKLVSGLEYQSCETDDWTDTLAHRQLLWIRDAAIRQLPGYDAADWALRHGIPAIEALYANHPYRQRGP